MSAAESTRTESPGNEPQTPLDARISVQQEDFDVGAEIAALSQDDVAAGAVASFVGLVRADAPEAKEALEAHATQKTQETRDAAGQGDAVCAMTLEHYPGMTEASLAAIAETAWRRWRLRRLRVIHRFGRLLPGQRIVFVGVASSHRDDAFAACRFVMDYLKTQAPFWKKEETAAGASRWVDARKSDDVAAARWDAGEGANS